MSLFLASGTISYLSLHQEEFPNVDMGMIQVSVSYRGSSPDESEQAICLRLEEALESAENIEEMTSTAREGGCDASLELAGGADLNRVLNDIKGKVDAISTFPIDAERPIVRAFSATGTVISLALSGDVDDLILKNYAEDIRNDLLDLEGVSTVGVQYVRPLEIAIEVSEYTLRQYSLTLDQISRAIERASLDMPGGTIRTVAGEILLRTKGQVYRADEYADIIVQTYADGTQLRLGDIAEIRDDFEEGYLNARINGKNAIVLEVLRVGDEDIVASAEQVRAYYDQALLSLPPNLSLDMLNDAAIATQERIGTVAGNAISGLVMVLIILTLFLRFKLALWVAAGIPIALAGAIALFPLAGLSISSLTIMGFVLVLGIIVDDAIVVGENVHAWDMKGLASEDAAAAATLEVSVPVIFGVFTTIAAFLPILLLEGPMGAFFNAIGAVVVLCLLASLIESQLILPAHLAHRKKTGYLFEHSRLVKFWTRFQGKISDAMENFARNTYGHALKKSLKYRYATWSTATGVIILTAALVFSGRVIFQFMPAVEGDVIYGSIQMPEGIAGNLTEEAINQMEQAALELSAELNEELVALKASGDAPESTERVVSSILTVVGQNAARGGPPMGRGSVGGSHIAEVVINLTPFFDRGETSSEVIRDRWRAKVGNIPDALELNFVSDTFSAGDALNFRLEGRDEAALQIAAAELRAELARYPGVFGITDSFRAGKQEVQIEMLDAGKNLGLTLNDVATQVRQAFYGIESQRIQRGTDDIRVMVRYPEAERRSLGNLEDLLIRTPSGADVPFSSIADFSLGNGYSSINRQNGKRVITVRSDIDRTVVKPDEIRAEVIAKYQDKWARDLNVDMVVGGEGEQQMRSMSELFSSVPLAMLVIFALLAVPLKSYLQPLIIMSVIPFGAIGAILGHFIMGAELVFFSMLGIIALSGVVVNASLVLVVNINRRREEGVPIEEAVQLSAISRFRAIFLTATTTFVGLVPLMITASPATFFIVPMAISLAWGVLFATLITLFLVPALYLILHDVIGYGDDPVPTVPPGSVIPST